MSDELEFAGSVVGIGLSANARAARSPLPNEAAATAGVSPSHLRRERICESGLDIIFLGELCLSYDELFECKVTKSSSQRTKDFGACEFIFVCEDSSANRIDSVQ